MYTVYVYMYFILSIIYIPCLPCLYFLDFTDPEGNKESTGLVTDNARNLMTAVGEVLNATESAFIKVPPEDRVHLSLNWVKK